MDLKEQMVQRVARQASDGSSADDHGDAIDAILNGKGRRHNGPMVLPPKAGYAAELREQMTIDSAKRAANKEQMLSLAAAGPDGVFAGQAAQNRGKRPATKIDQVSKSSLGMALQEQIGEKASVRAESAFHAQMGAAAEANPQGLQGGRKKIPLPPTSKKEYAAFLQEQMARRSDQNREHSDGVFNTAFIGGAAKQSERGRRHADQMPALSKADLRTDLQRQMAEREAQRNEQNIHRQALPLQHVDLAGTEGDFAEQQLPMRMATGTHGDSLERLLSEHAVGQVC